MNNSDIAISITIYDIQRNAQAMLGRNLTTKELTAFIPKLKRRMMYSETYKDEICEAIGHEFYKEIDAKI